MAPISQPITSVQFPNIGEFGAIVLIMEVTFINGDHYAHNIISLYSKASRPEVKF